MARNLVGSQNAASGSILVSRQATRHSGSLQPAPWYGISTSTYIAHGMGIYPDHPPLLVMLGLLALQNGDTDIAKQALERAVLIRPEFDAVYLLATVQAKQGLHEDSIGTIQTYFGDRMGHSQVRALMAVNIYRMGEEELALSLFNWNPSLTEDQRRAVIEAF